VKLFKINYVRISWFFFVKLQIVSKLFGIIYHQLCKELVFFFFFFLLLLNYQLFQKFK
jgi:hypothetical protein